MDQLRINGRDVKTDLLKFAQELVRIKSFSGQEGEAVKFIAAKMQSLGYDEVVIDAFGNVLGRIGTGDKVIMFDSHIDTVTVNDEDSWDVPPFSGAIIDDRLWGRGSVDMKSGAAASIYAAIAAKNMGLDSGKTIYVSCTAFEEDCDGENLRHLFKECKFQPDYLVICEPSSNLIATGHKGKAQIVIKTKGISAHSSAPEKGANAVYEMAEIIQRVEKRNLELMQKDGRRGTLALSRISSTSASLNAVPSLCEIYLDRRMVPGETEETIKNELEQIIKGKNATWEIGTLHRTTWTGMAVKYDPFHPAWEIDLNHGLVKTFIEAYNATFGRYPDKYEYWDFSTNAVAAVRLGIPTIGFGPGEFKLAHMRNENCQVSQIIEACTMYANVIKNI